MTVFTEPSKKYVLHTPSGSEHNLQRARRRSVNRRSSSRAAQGRRPPRGSRAETPAALIYVNVPEGIHVFPKHIKTHPETATLGLIYGLCLLARVTWARAPRGKGSSLLRGTC